MFTSIWGALFGLIIQSATINIQSASSLPTVTQPPSVEQTVDQVQTKEPESATTGSTTDQLAKCLSKKGITMYGAYWCPHCSDQKKLFGSSFQYVKYVECDPKGPNGNAQACKSAGIAAYPTWISGTGEKEVGIKQLSELATWGKCSF